MQVHGKQNQPLTIFLVAPPESKGTAQCFADRLAYVISNVKGGLKFRSSVQTLTGYSFSKEASEEYFTDNIKRAFKHKVVIIEDLQAIYGPAAIKLFNSFLGRNAPNEYVVVIFTINVEKSFDYLQYANLVTETSLCAKWVNIVPTTTLRESLQQLRAVHLIVRPESNYPCVVDLCVNKTDNQCKNSFI